MVSEIPSEEEEDCTVEQLSALNKRVNTLDLPPFVDLGVWQPYGRRALRATKFRAWFPDGAGGYMARELPGPANWSQWLAAWRVFQTAAIMLDILPLATLQLYERHIERLVKLYPAAWHVVVLADEKARGEKWARIRLRISADIAAGKSPPDLWDSRKPWIASMHALVGDTAFWEDQVRSPANAWMAAGGRGVARSPEESFVSQASTLHSDPGDPFFSARKSTKEKRLAKKRRIQADKEELKAFRSANKPGGKADGKGGFKDGNLKAKDQAGGDLYFSWDSALGTVRRMCPWAPYGMTASAGFCFLHLFSGVKDKLGDAIREEAAAEGIQVTIEAYDIETGSDLTDHALLHRILSKARRGGYHGGHSGFPCTTFTRLRWRRAPGLPGPVRSREHIYGLPSNSRAQQDEADRGTLMACQSAEILDAISRSGSDTFERPVTIENPPETDHPEAGSAYCLPEIVAWVDREGTEFADFNNCIYANPNLGEQPYKKPQRFVGRLRGLSSLSGTCKCGKDFIHPKVVGVKASRDSASYPVALCTEYARLVVKTWKGRRQPNDIEPPPFTPQTPRVIQEAEWEGGEGKFGGLRQQVSKKAQRDLENKEAIGGLRRPIWSLERVPGLRSVGQAVSNLFDEYVRENQEAARAAEAYGSEGFQIRHVEGWKRRLDDHFGVDTEASPVQLKGFLHYDTPAHVALLMAWIKQVGDPDEEVVRWLKEGAPLGANSDIATCGIFPLKDSDEVAWLNYKSFVDNKEDSEEEMRRLADLGYIKTISKEEAERYFTKPVVSRLGLIIKEKADGTRKRRIIVDALRSGANKKARCPERIILPRPSDVYTMAADLKHHEPQLLEWYRAEKRPTTEWGSELVAADLTDAFTHFPTAPAEHEQCLSPAGDGRNYVVFIAMFFGHKCAPLIMCRLAALLSRLLQGLFWQAELQLATYIDDPLMALVGSRPRRIRNLSLALLTLGALGIRLAWHKGSRGSRIVWIGVQFTLRWREGVLDNEIPDKLRRELLEKLIKWASGGLVPLGELRTFAGKLTWAAGIYKRARWAVSVVYGAITAHEAEVKAGEEAARREKRQDKRIKDNLVPVRRFEMARLWLATLLQDNQPVTRRSLWTKPATLMFVTDASPQGCGGLLLVRASTRAPWTILKAFEYQICKDDADLLGFVYQSHKSQAYLEALAIFLALKEWGPLIRSIKVGVAIRSDSTVALSLLEKAASSTPALNLLSSEMALKLEHLQVDEVTLSHLPGKINALADWLSRPATRGGIPESLQEVKTAKPARLRREDFKLGLARSHDASQAGAMWAALTD